MVGRVRAGVISFACPPSFLLVLILRLGHSSIVATHPMLKLHSPFRYSYSAPFSRLSVTMGSRCVFGRLCHLVPAGGHPLHLQLLVSLLFSHRSSFTRCYNLLFPTRPSQPCSASMIGIDRFSATPLQFAAAESTLAHHRLTVKPSPRDLQ